MPIKILSVDDEMDLEVLLTQYFRRKIRKGEYEFAFAHNGIEALKMLLERKDFDIILSDINMPEMDGLTLLSKVNELQNRAMKCIMVSAYGDMSNIRAAMNNGAFDFATKPIDLDDLALTIEKAVENINFIKNSSQEHSQLVSIKGDLAVAGEIQRGILPQVFPPFPELRDKVDIYASMTPAKEVGGDFYDIFKINDNHLGFVMADVSGKGVPAALFMAVSRTMIKAIGRDDRQSNQCITEANKLLCGESVDSMFVTLFYGIMDCRTGAIDYTNAGHNPPYIVRKNGKIEQLEQSRNMVMGVFDDVEYENDHANLQPGDSLVLYTDGVTEAANGAGEMFGETSLELSLGVLPKLGAKEAVDMLRSDVKTFAGGAEQNDDMTLMVIKRLS